jgi:hypothetical protein
MLLNLFSEVSQDKIVTGLFGNIYDYANPQSRSDAIEKLSVNCELFMSDVSFDEQLQGMIALCDDDEEKQRIIESCSQIEALRGRIDPDELADMQEACELFENGEFEKQCETIKEEKDMDFSGMEKICMDYSEGKINERDFFQRTVSEMTPKDLSSPKQTDNPVFKFIGFMEKINELSIYLTILFFFLLVFFYMKDYHNLILKIGTILINIAVFILLPYLLVKVYITTNPIDTSFIMDMMGKGMTQDFTVQAIKALVPILVLDYFTLPLLVIALCFLGIGVFVKIVFHHHHKPMNPEQKNIDKHVKEKEYHEKRSV